MASDLPGPQSNAASRTTNAREWAESEAADEDRRDDAHDEMARTEEATLVHGHVYVDRAGRHNRRQVRSTYWQVQRPEAEAPKTHFLDGPMKQNLINISESPTPV